MNTIKISHPGLEDLNDISALYRAVAAIEGGLARAQDEISDDYVRHNLVMSQARGLSLIARIDGKIAGEIHCYNPAPRVFAHVLSDLTIAVHPDFQGSGVGKVLFTQLLAEVTTKLPHISRVELIARESNQRAIGFYQKLGFVIEGKMVNRIKNSNGQVEADIPMAWHRA